ncbi:ECF transporter S component [Halothermothrix orenii]|uniref:Riboflavin transporter n=1 Tax=Halothermothrix orenii (strain H 168 / OCM 544 / DSM 9562) TaxID=373903 RepID=B8CX32_HALOH|nr:ECF transporter S component [Halothermothrix orenii]ACL69851.1 predicted membrane protein [Halothermothrix orenii H 168]
MRDTNKLTAIGVLSALSLLLMVLIKFPLIPTAPYLIYEPGDVPILIISFAYGPIPALIVTFILSILMALFTGLGGLFGAIMHFLATGTLTLVAGVIYKRKHNRSGAITGLLMGSVAMTVVMVIANVLLDPYFMGFTREQIIAILAPAIIPFNIVKSLLNSFITFIIYKKISYFLKDKGLKGFKSA